MRVYVVTCQALSWNALADQDDAGRIHVYTSRALAETARKRLSAGGARAKVDECETDIVMPRDFIAIKRANKERKRASA